ncbi:MAG: autorepressor SdpR family transcription factor [Clostridiales bacterium]|nr:autorepressor SdpR family transcription factor [Clostridiales bacterium]
MPLQQTLRALSDPTRREIVTILKSGPQTAGQLSSRFTISAAAVSKHLSVLKDAGLVRIRREGTCIIYELNASVLEELLTWLLELKGDTP